MGGGGGGGGITWDHITPLTPKSDKQPQGEGVLGLRWFSAARGLEIWTPFDKGLSRK